MRSSVKLTKSDRLHLTSLFILRQRFLNEHGPTRGNDASILLLQHSFGFSELFVTLNACCHKKQCPCFLDIPAAENRAWITLKSGNMLEQRNPSGREELMLYMQPGKTATECAFSPDLHLYLLLSADTVCQGEDSVVNRYPGLYPGQALSFPTTRSLERVHFSLLHISLAISQVGDGEISVIVR